MLEVLITERGIEAGTELGALSTLGTGLCEEGMVFRVTFRMEMEGKRRTEQ